MEPLTLDDERQLRLHYVLQLNQMAGILRLPTNVRHAAIIFFQRFFLQQSVMEYSPKDVVYCCIYLACKSEEHHLPLERMIGEIMKTQQTAKDAAAAAPPHAIGAPTNAAMKTVSTVLSLEVPVLSELRFQLRVYHLARAGRGLIKELEETEPAALSAGLYINASDPALTQKGAPGTSLQSVAQFLSTRSTVLHDHALWTDAIFLHAPSQIALACLERAESEAREFGIDVTLDTSAPGSAAQLPIKSLGVVARFLARLSTTHTTEQMSTMRSKLDTLRSELLAGQNAPHTIDKRSLKAIEKRRKVLTNPALDPSSAEAAAARAEKEAEKEARRDAKKKKQREENAAREYEALMGPSTTMTNATAASSAPLMDDDDDGGFQISKRTKSTHDTPAGPGIAPPRFDDVDMNDATTTEANASKPAANNLNSQFDDVME